MENFDYDQCVMDFSILNKLLSYFHSHDLFLVEQDATKCYEMVAIWVSISLSLSSEEKIRCKTLITSDIVGFLKNSHAYELLYTYECFLDLVEIESLVKDETFILSEKHETSDFSFQDLAKQFVESGNYKPLKELMFNMDREFNSMSNRQLKWLWLSTALIND